MKKPLLTIILFFTATLLAEAQHYDWSWKNPLPTGLRLHGVSFSGNQVGTATGNFGTILRTSDGGVTWEQQVSGTLNNLFAVHFINENTGTIVGAAGTILRTTDGGHTWTARQRSANGRPPYSGLRCCTAGQRCIYLSPTHTGIHPNQKTDDH